MTAEKALRYLLLGTILMVPLTYTPGVLHEEFNTPKLALLLAAAALAISLRVAAALSGMGATRLTTLGWPAGLTAAAFVASWLLSDYRGWSLLGLYSRYGGLLPYLAVLTLALLTAETFAGRPRPVLIAAVVSGALVGLFGLIQMLFLGEYLVDAYDTSYITSTVGYSNFAGGYLAIVLPLAVAFWVEGRSSQLALPATALIAAALLFTFSQGAWLAAAAALAFMIGHLPSWKNKVAARLGTAVAGLVAFAVVAVVLVTLAVPHPMVRLPDVLATAVSRGFLWEQTWDAALDRPLFGWGPNAVAIQGPIQRTVEDALFQNFAKGDDPHSVPLAMLANLGIAGFVAFIAVLVWAFRPWYGRMSVLHLGTGSALIAYGIQALVSVDELTLRFMFWILLAVVAAARVRRDETSPVDRPRQERAWRRSLAAVAVLIGIAAAAVSAVVIVSPDRDVRRGVDLFRAGRVKAGSKAFDRALRLHPSQEYQTTAAETLAFYSIDHGLAASGSLEKAHALFLKAGRFPDSQVRALHGEALAIWGTLQPFYRGEALRAYRAARQLDPFNPLIALAIADLELVIGQAERALEVLQPFERLLGHEYTEYSDRYAEVWAGLALSYIGVGDEAGARHALDQVDPAATGSCRFLIAEQLLDPQKNFNRAQFEFVCPPRLQPILGDG